MAWRRQTCTARYGNNNLWRAAVNTWMYGKQGPTFLASWLLQGPKILKHVVILHIGQTKKCVLVCPEQQNISMLKLSYDSCFLWDELCSNKCLKYKQCIYCFICFRLQIKHNWYVQYSAPTHHKPVDTGCCVKLLFARGAAFTPCSVYPSWSPLNLQSSLRFPAS